MLDDLHHVVLEASSGAGALELLRSGAIVDVVVTDHAMPAMTGTELAKQIKENWPGLPVILATGFAELAEGEEIGRPRLAKPFSQAELAVHIAAVAGEEPAANVVPIRQARCA